VTPNLGDAFFHYSAVNDAIERIACANVVTIIAGAGVAKDRGSPDWATLAKAILERLMISSADVDVSTNAKAIALMLAQSEDPLRLASATRWLATMQNLSSDAIDRLIAEELDKYPGFGGTLAPGIALLASTLKASGCDVAIITTNYDENIELAARGPQLRSTFSSLGVGKLVASIDERPPSNKTDIPVYHLHGVVAGRGPPSGTAHATPIYCETDYAAIRRGWQERLLIKRLKAGSCLFLGTSLTDPYFPYCLSRARRPKHAPWYALIATQGETWLPAALEQADTPMGAIQFMAGARLRHLGIDPLFADYFSQVSQFCYEAVNCLSNGKGSYAEGSPHRYGQRLINWHAEWSASIARQSLKGHQLQSQRKLMAVKRNICAALPLQRDEKVKVELWVRSDPLKERSLTLWSSSESALLAEEALHTAPIRQGSDYLAVRTFAQGNALGPRIPEGISTGRWKSGIAVPIWLDDAPWLHLPVGVIGILGTSETSLGSQEVTERARIARKLDRTGSSLLRPK